MPIRPSPASSCPTKSPRGVPPKSEVLRVPPCRSKRPRRGSLLLRGSPPGCCAGLHHRQPRGCCGRKRFGSRSLTFPGSEIRRHLPPQFENYLTRAPIRFLQPHLRLGGSGCEGVGGAFAPETRARGPPGPRPQVNSFRNASGSQASRLAFVIAGGPRTCLIRATICDSESLLDITSLAPAGPRSLSSSCRGA